jgi:endonuclease/exonuclease/phosphatase family metal-dependent hydrolase
LKRYLISILTFLIVVSTTIFSETAEIGVFNTLRLGRSKNKDYIALAKAIEKQDVIGIVEVMTREGIEKLVMALEEITGERYDYHLTPYSVGKSGYKEYYGYVWKSEKVTFLKSVGFYEDKEKLYMRPPYGADFKIGNFDFTFVLTHIIYGKKESHRRAEVFKLDEVYDYFQNLDPEENDIIIGGDFNLSTRDEAFELLLQHEDKIINTISPDIKTTIGTKGFANAYDNIFISTKYTKEYTGESGAIDYTGGDYKTVRKVVSDHLPVFIKVDISGEDDD